MAFDYAEMVELADELLTEFGASVTVIHMVAGDATEDNEVPLVETVETGTGCMFDYERVSAGAQNADGSLIESTDKQLLLSPVNRNGVSILEPVPDMSRVVVGGQRYVIKNVKTVSPSGTVVIYDCNVRK